VKAVRKLEFVSLVIAAITVALIAGYFDYLIGIAAVPIFAVLGYRTGKKRGIRWRR
jgi:hypothetical protein